MRVLVTGGAGFIGRHVCERLLDTGHEVVVLDATPSVHPAVKASADLRTADVRDPDALDDALAGIDVVCHLAAKVGMGVDVHDIPDYAGVNVHGTATLLAAMARQRVRRLVLASSMVVYGEGLGHCDAHGDVLPAARDEAALRAGCFEPPCPHCGAALLPVLVSEDAPIDPRNAYAASKVAQEHFATAWARATGGAVACLRYHNVYGPGMPRHTPYAGVAAIFSSMIEAGQRPRVFEDGRQRRDFVHVRDVAAATAATLEQVRDGVTALNVGSGTVRTVGDMATALSDAAGGPFPMITGTYRLGDVRHITADSTRLRRIFGWSPTVDFESGIAELVR